MLLETEKNLSFKSQFPAYGQNAKEMIVVEDNCKQGVLVSCGVWCDIQYMSNLGRRTGSDSANQRGCGLTNRD